METVHGILGEAYNDADKIESDLNILTDSSKPRDVSKTNNKPSNNKEKISSTASPRNKPLKVASHKAKNKANLLNSISTLKDDDIFYERTTSEVNNAQKYKNKDGGNGERHRRKGPRRIERCFGWFACRQCKIDWASAYTWRIKWSKRVIYRQQCNKCRVYLFPYDNDYLRCPICKEIVEYCVCPKGEIEEEKEPLKPHRYDLCEKCKTSSPCRYGRH